jgi:hypothetical protein
MRTAIMTTIEKAIEGRRVLVEVGSVIENAAGRTEKLLPSDWDRAQFRFPNPIPGWEVSRAIACNVDITGRTFQERGRGNWFVKVRLIWVGDGDPDTVTEGWLAVNPWACEYAD